ncbi:hypothetical protein KM043_005874 [Ampulex compressa]|nr:hypothetical protein KM043_005874 [Ampulex compressa]
MGKKEGLVIKLLDETHLTPPLRLSVSTSNPARQPMPRSRLRPLTDLNLSTSLCPPFSKLDLFTESFDSSLEAGESRGIG